MPSIRTTTLEDVDIVSNRLELLLSEIFEKRQNNSLPEDLSNSDLFSDLNETLSSLIDQRVNVLNSTQHSKQMTFEAKTFMDEKQMGLSNALYEKRHIVEEIIKCREFRSLYQHIGLVPVDDFMKSALEEYRQGIENPHTLMINRLKFELYERTKLKMEKERLDADRTILLRDNHKIEDQVDRLDKQLDDAVQAVLTVHQALAEDEAKRERNVQSGSAAGEEPMNIDIPTSQAQ